MENNTVQVEVQDFDGKDYMLSSTQVYKDQIFDVFVCIEEPHDIKVFKQVPINGEIEYETATENEWLNVLAMCPQEQL